MYMYLDLLPLNIVYFVRENGNFVLENNISLAVGTIYLVCSVLFQFSVFPKGTW